MNDRLGRLGFFAHPALAGEAPDDPDAPPAGLTSPSPESASPAAAAEPRVYGDSASAIGAADTAEGGWNGLP